MPTKNPAPQHYSKLIYGGWRILNARDAAIEIQEEDGAWRGAKENSRSCLAVQSNCLIVNWGKTANRRKSANSKKGTSPKVRKETAENQTLSKSSPLIVVTGSQDDSSQPIPLQQTIIVHSGKIKNLFPPHLFRPSIPIHSSGQFSIRPV